MPVIEAPPLARALHKACDLDQEIPYRLFDGVAKVLAFVHRLQGRSSLTGRVHPQRHPGRRGLRGTVAAYRQPCTRLVRTYEHCVDITISGAGWR